MWPASVLERLERVRDRGGGQYSARCPAHDDRNPSLTVAVRGGKLLVTCWAGCTKANILRALGITMAELFEPKDEPAPFPPVKRKVVAVYRYEDEEGLPLYEVVRFDPKGFAQRRRCTGPGCTVQDRCTGPRDGYHWCLGSVRRVLYRLPAIVARPTLPVVVVEGEKDADRLAIALPNVVATTAAGGTDLGGSRWLDGYSQSLAGRRVVVIPDCDRPGMLHAQSVVGSLIAHGCRSVRLVRLPYPVTAHHGKDVSDWLDDGHGAADLVGLIRAAGEWTAGAA